MSRFWRSLWRPTNGPAALAFAVIIVAAAFADYQNGRVYQERLRSDVLDAVSLVRAKLEGNINGNIQLVRGLVATLATEPGMDQHRFTELALNVHPEKSQLRSIAAAPNLVVSMVYPLEGNERALGLDYRQNEAQREAAFRARDTGELVLAGPVELVQGGRGFVGRFPVFYDAGSGGRMFWGIVSAVVDTDRLYRDSGLLDPDLPIDIAITGRDGVGDERFFGPQGVLEDNPVDGMIMLPSGSWRIAAVPKGGWDVTPPNAWTLRALMLLAGALILVPTVVTGRLIDERTRNVNELGRRERELQRLSQRLRLALDASQIGVWELDLENDQLFWDNRTSELFGQPPRLPPSVVSATGPRPCIPTISPMPTGISRRRWKAAAHITPNTVCCCRGASCAIFAKAARSTRTGTAPRAWWASTGTSRRMCGSTRSSNARTC